MWLPRVTALRRCFFGEDRSQLHVDNAWGRGVEMLVKKGTLRCRGLIWYQEQGPCTLFVHTCFFLTQAYHASRGVQDSALR